ncbi:hypothetical protein DNTS_021971 [Danionella cerebrum]|uniref:Uncharacterized protein n=1 Tax=Danionella cerebrum TaxID=2873325 RepID=A0A553QLN5_9TELE|nr:hypothetical protein DNTS_021971 [Danionella translucida]
MEGQRLMDETKGRDLSKRCLSRSVDVGVMADHSSPLESGQLLSPDIPMLASPPPPPHPGTIVNGDGPQQLLGSLCVSDPDLMCRYVMDRAKVMEGICPSSDALRVFMVKLSCHDVFEWCHNLLCIWLYSRNEGLVSPVTPLFSSYYLGSRSWTEDAQLDVRPDTWVD